MTLLIILLPLLFTPFILLGHRRVRYRTLIAFGALHLTLVGVAYRLGQDPLPVIAPWFDLTPLNITFLLAHAGLQLVAFLSLPRLHRTQRHLVGVLLFSSSAAATMTARAGGPFIASFVISLFMPCLWAFMEEGGRKNVRVFFILALVCAGLTLLAQQTHSNLALGLPLLFAASIRMGFVPFHLWVRRMVLGFPIQWSVLYFLSYPSIALFLRARLSHASAPIHDYYLELAGITAIYGAWLALVQKELRTAFYFLLLSFLGSIGVGLAMASGREALSGVLLFWFSGSLAVAGFGLTIEIIESRFGKISILEARGLIQQVPAIAALFLLFGLASVGFPGLCAFIGEEVMLSGIYRQSIWAVLPLLFALSLNGVTVLRWFAAIFFGPDTSHGARVDLLKRERLAFFILLAIIVGTGVFPRPLFELGQRAADMFDEPLHPELTEEAPRVAPL